MGIDDVAFIIYYRNENLITVSKFIYIKCVCVWVWRLHFHFSLLSVHIMMMNISLINEYLNFYAEQDFNQRM